MCDESFDSSQLDDSFHEEFLTPKAIALRKIEFMCADVQQQVERGDDRVTMRTSFNTSDYQIKFRNSDNKILQRHMICTLQIYDLLLNDKKSTKRELYYERKDIYEKQDTADRCIQKICELLNETRANLNILSCSKGILRGSISFLTQSIGVVDGRNQTVLISEELVETPIINDAQFILVVEKESSFQKLLDERFIDIFPQSVIVTGKGYPDICTRIFLKKLVDKLNIPIFGLFDADPHGIEIFLTYKYGSVRGHSESHDAFIPSIRWLGVFPSDASKFPIFSNQFLNLSRADRQKIEKLKNRAFQLREREICQELEYISEMGYKLEIEAISSINESMLARMLILPRIRDAFLVTEF